MRRLMGIAAAAALFLFAGVSHAADFQQRWVYGTMDLSTDAGLTKFISLLQECKAAGVTHMTINDGFSTKPDLRPAGYAERVKKALDEAKQDGVALCPLVFPIGYSGSYFRDNANLAAGIPARDEPFIVHDGKAAPDPAAVPNLVNGDFNDVKDGKPAGWQSEASELPCISSDASVKHGDSGASLKLTDFSKLPPGTHDVHVFQIIDGVKPFQYYHLSFWAKTENNNGDPEDYLRITSSNGMRRNNYKNINVNGNSDWTKYECTFNTFEVPDGKLRFAIGVGKDEPLTGAIWIDDIKIEPAGMLLILRRPIKPLVVKSEDGATTYTEGKDFEPVADPVVSAKPFSGEFTTDHDAPLLVLTKNSKIKDGQRLSVSFFHDMRIYNDQDVISMQDPGTLDLMDAQMKYMAETWPVNDYFMKHDEIRITGWEVQPDDQHLTPGQILAKNAKAGYDIIHKYRPGATVYTFSDMYNPYHNARPFKSATHEGGGYYYFCNGNYDGSWEGLPNDVVIANWYAKDTQGPKFFADKGYKQILCGFYDGTSTQAMQANITSWMKVTDGVQGVIGFMYTTWHSNYKQLPEYFDLVKQYPNFANAAPAAPLKGR